jgi:hypothetical protein
MSPWQFCGPLLPSCPLEQYFCHTGKASTAGNFEAQGVGVTGNSLRHCLTQLGIALCATIAFLLFLRG